MMDKIGRNVESSFKMSFKIWSAFLFLMNAFFGIAASYVKLFPHLWGIQTLGYFSLFNVISIITLLLATWVAGMYRENKLIRQQIEELKADLDASRENIARGFMTIGKHSFMVSEFNDATGHLKYEDKRCLLMSSDTMQSVFSMIKEKSPEFLKDVGYHVDWAFGMSFRRYLKAEYPTTDLELDRQLDIWCEYDKNAGFGVFSNKVLVDGIDFSGEIHLLHSFLTEDRSVEDESLCDFMGGYVEGVLNRITNRHNREINVSHIACDLHTPGKPNLGCRFKISSVGEVT